MVQQIETLCEQAEGQAEITWLLTMFTTILCVKVHESDPQIRGPQRTSVLSRRGTINQDQLPLIVWQPKVEMSVGEVTEVVTHRLTLPEFLLSTVKVKVHVQALHKLCNWIFVGVRFLKKGKYNKFNYYARIHLYVYVSKQL